MNIDGWRVGSSSLSLDFYSLCFDRLVVYVFNWNEINDGIKSIVDSQARCLMEFGQERML